MIKNLIRKVHLWLGLASGIIVFIVSVTGCLYVFNNEIQGQLRKQAIWNEESKQEHLPLEELWGKAARYFGEDKAIGWANLYRNPSKNWVFYTYNSNPEKLTYFGMIEHYESVYINPYTGEIAGSYDEEKDFFSVVKFLHWSLLLRTPIGQPIVGWSTFIFVILLITGMVLWWPKSFKKVNNRFWISWRKKTTAYRKNYDLHNVLGFYSLFFGLIIALTGMVWSFKWFKAFVYVLAAGTATAPEPLVANSVVGESAHETPMELALEKAQEEFPHAAGFRISPPREAADPLRIYVREKEGVYYRSAELLFDQYTGELLRSKKHEDKNFGEKLITANYDIHVGAILGLPGKILAFLVSLFCASLPVTGFLMWWKKRKLRQEFI